MKPDPFAATLRERIVAVRGNAIAVLGLFLLVAIIVGLSISTSSTQLAGHVTGFRLVEERAIGTTPYAFVMLDSGKSIIIPFGSPFCKLGSRIEVIESRTIFGSRYTACRCF